MSRTLARERFLQITGTGRGLTVYDFPVELEPLLPWTLTRISDQRPVDDARIPSFLERLFAAKQSDRLIATTESENNILKTPQECLDFPVVSFLIYLPSELKTTSEQTEQLLLNLANSASFISFEIIGTGDSVSFQIACPETEKDTVRAQLENHLPIVQFRESEDLLGRLFSPKQAATIVDYALARAWFLPLPFGKHFATDPLLPLIASMEELTEGETACLQVLFSRTRRNWQQAAREAIFDRSGKPVFADLQNLLPAIKAKLEQTVLAARIRFVAQSSSREKSLQAARRAMVFFRQFSSPGGNGLIPLQNKDSEPKAVLQNFLRRVSSRSGMLLSASELAAIARLPSDAVQSANLVRDERKTKPAPKIATAGDLALGENTHAGRTTLVSLSREQRTRHLWCTGATGVGKSSLVVRLAEQDMQTGEGLMTIEPHGDLIDQIVARVPDNRLKDVILFDPADEDFPVGFNILSAHNEREKTLLASDLVGIFKRFSTSFGDVMHSVLSNAVLAFLESSEGGTLLDLKRFLVDKSFRAKFLETIQDEEIKYYWTDEFPQLKGNPYAPLLTRLDTFLRSKLIRNIVAQKENKLDFRRIMDERKILLLRLSHGAIGEENAYLLGSLILAKLYHAALSRQDAAESERSLFTCFSDEAHHFIVPSLSLLLSGARKYGISILLSHQELQQVASRDPDVLASLFANAYTRICFRLGDTDAEKMAKGFSYFTAEHLKNLSVGEAVCRVERAEYDFNLKTEPLAPIPTEIAERRKAEIVRNTRELYAAPKVTVEAELQSRRGASAAIRKIKDKQPFAEIPAHNEVRSAENSTDVHLVEVQKTPLPARKADESGKRNKPLDKPAKTPVPALIPPAPKKGSESENNRQHLYLQSLVKRMAEARGFLATAEKEVFGGSGKIDVSLEREDLRVAVEISVTTRPDYELNNIQKCLAAGYVPVVILAGRRHLENIRKKAEEAFDEAELEKVLFLEPDEFNSFLESIPAEKERQGRRVKGFRVNLKLKQSDKPEQNARQQVISEVVLKAMKRLKKDPP